MSKRVLIEIQPYSDKCGDAKKPWGFYPSKSSICKMVTFPENSYEDLPPGSRVWAEIEKKGSKIYGRPISVNGKPYLDKRNQ
ncbi:MAG: hypothetical protein KQA41_01835 [Candidatus Aenigmarchaeota archaeon]|nr:hypothetical protein [Candidatus Aenigmarchaeota archaeon]